MRLERPPKPDVGCTRVTPRATYRSRGGVHDHPSAIRCTSRPRACTWRRGCRSRRPLRRSSPAPAAPRLVSRCEAAAGGRRVCRAGPRNPRSRRCRHPDRRDRERRRRSGSMFRRASVHVDAPSCWDGQSAPQLSRPSTGDDLAFSVPRQAPASAAGTRVRRRALGMRRLAMAADGSPVLPGRLGRRTWRCRTTRGRSADGRGDGSVRAGRAAGRRPVDGESPLEELLEYSPRPRRGSRRCSPRCAADCPPSRASRERRGDPGRRRQRHHAVHPSARRDGATPLPGMLHLHGGGMVLLEAAGRGVRPVARRAGRRRPGRRRRRVPQRRRQARRLPVPGRAQRLHVGAAVGGRQQGRARASPSSSCRASRAAATSRSPPR